MPTKRLFSQAVDLILPNDWCAYERRVKRQKATTAGQAGVIASGVREGSPAAAVKVSHPEKSTRRGPIRPLGHQFISETFAERLKEAIECDEKHKRLSLLVVHGEEKYKKILTAKAMGGGSRSAKTGQDVSTLRDEEAEVKAKQRRKRALDKLYQIAQEEIDRPPEEENNTSHSLPDVFFNEFGVLLACRTFVQGHSYELDTARLRLIELSSRLGGLDPYTEEAEALRDQRYEASDEHTQLRADSAIYAQILTEYLEGVLEIARPHLVVEPKTVDGHTDAENVLHGADHVPLVDEALAEEVKAIPSRYPDLLEAVEAAVRLTDGAQGRHSRLARDYYQDLRKSLEDSPGLSREDFDRQFVKDRAQAMGDIVVAERHYGRLVKRLRDEQLLPLEDRVSQFGSVSGDGQTCTMGP
ncbi:hypothetical protein LTR37_011908 [Vermiconidia calcicola]|uniref:Uncharacterized protein n=1 Tax=Vermiconidia calcicola TaxID=1690605 RepID=A0ACC3N178_9PEZI|nr:hypothetical protein LTR37_011908 [Vermiconidia calcicola]